MTHAEFIALCKSLKARADAAFERRAYRLAAELRARLAALKHGALRK